MKLDINKLVFYLLFFATFINLRYIESYNYIKDGCLFIVAIYIFSRLPLINIGKYKKVNIILFAFVAVLLVTMIINFSTAKHHLNEMIIFCAAVVEFFLCMEIAIKKGNVFLALKCIRNALFAVLLVNDLLLYTIDMEVNSQSVYFIGDKFYVLYAHLVCLALYLTDIPGKRHEKKWKIACMVIGSLITIIVGDRMESGSTLVCVILFVAFYLLLGLDWNWLFTGNFVLIILIFSSLFVVAYEVIINIPIISYFITDILKKTLLLSNRVIIYLTIPEVLQGHLFTGYGFGTSYEVWTRRLGYGNAQNGLADWICQCGIFVVIPIFLLIYNTVEIRDCRKRRIARPMLAVVAMLSTYAAIEITINVQYIACLAMVFGIAMCKIDE